MPNINIHLKEFRIFRKITQEDLASEIGKSKNVISNWESGLNRPDVDSVESICKILHVTPNQIFGWEPLPEYEHHKKCLMHIEQERKTIKKELEQKQMQLYKLDKEYRRMMENFAQETNKTDQPNDTTPDQPRKIAQPNAAHAIPGAPEEDQQHDNDIMDDENF